MGELIRVEHGLPFLNAETSRDLAEFEQRIKELKEREEHIKAKLLEEMREKGIKKVDTPDITITYIDETDRESFDSKRFRVEHPDLFDEYISMSTVKASVRIKAK